MAKYYTEAELLVIKNGKHAVNGKDYIQKTGPEKGTQYRGNGQGGLDFITNNFDILAQNAVGETLTDTPSANTIYTPASDSEEAEIDVSVNQMNLGDVLAFAAAN